MSTLPHTLQRVQETTEALVGSVPMSFERYLEAFGEDDEFELIDGVVVERMSAQLEHERLLVWLLTLFTLSAERFCPGVVLGSRTAVRIGEFRARLPDLLFVRAERAYIVQQHAVVGAPDMVIEIVSPGERRSDLLQREADYRTLGVEEIWLIDRPRRRVRLLRRAGEQYEEAEISSGVVQCGVIPQIRVDAEWLLGDDRPSITEVMSRFNP